MKKFLSFVFFLALIVSFANEGVVKLYKLNQFEESLKDEINVMNQNNLNLQKEIHDLKTPRYLENYIREELGYIKSNEIIYKISDASE